MKQLALASALVIVAGQALATVSQVTQADLVRMLQSGVATDRYQAIRRIRQIPLEQRDETLWVAMADELQRVGSESHARNDALRPGRQIPRLGEESEYVQA